MVGKFAGKIDKYPEVIKINLEKTCNVFTSKHSGMPFRS
jgi:hypothetical protein